MAAGSFALVSGSGQALPTTSWATYDPGTIDTDADSILSESSGVFTPQDEGYYLIVFEAKHTITHNNRHNWECKIQRNDTDVAGGFGSAYSRNNGNDLSWGRASIIQHFDGSTDDFRIQLRRDVGDGTVAGTHDWMRVKVVQITAGASTATPFLHVGTPTSAAYGGDTPTVVSGWDVITETDDTVLELSADDTITLKENGRPFLISYGIPTDATGGARTGRVTDLTLDGTRIAHSVAHAYQRDAGTRYATPETLALAIPDQTTEDVQIRCWGRTVTSWGTFSNGNWTASSARSGIMAIALPADADVALFDGSTGTTMSGNATTDLPVFDTESVAGTAFTRDSSTALTTSAATDTFLFGSVGAERTASSGTRQSNAVRWEREGVDETSFTEMGDYLRGDQGSADHYNGVYSSLWLGTTTAGDTFNLEKFDPGTDDGANDATFAAGAFAIELSSLADSGGGSTTVDPVGSSAAVASATASVAATAEVDGAGSSAAVASATASVAATAEVGPAGTSVAVASAAADVGSTTVVGPVGSSVPVTSATAAVEGTTDVAAVSSTAAVASAAASVAGTAEVDPVGSSAAVSSDVAGVSATIPIDPTGTTTAVTSATASIAGTAQIAPTGSTVAVTSDTANVGGSVEVPVDPVGTTITVVSQTAAITATADVAPIGSTVTVISAAVSQQTEPEGGGSTHPRRRRKYIEDKEYGYNDDDEALLLFALSR